MLPGDGSSGGVNRPLRAETRNISKKFAIAYCKTVSKELQYGYSKDVFRCEIFFFLFIEMPGAMVVLLRLVSFSVLGLQDIYGAGKVQRGRDWLRSLDTAPERCVMVGRSEEHTSELQSRE